MENERNNLIQLNKSLENGEIFGIDLGKIKRYDIYRGIDKNGHFYKHIGYADTQLESSISLCEYIGDGVCIECISGIKIKLDAILNPENKEDSDFNQDWLDLMRKYEEIKSIPLVYPIEVKSNDNSVFLSNIYRLDDNLKRVFSKDLNNLNNIEKKLKSEAKKDLEIFEICLNFVRDEEHEIASTENFIYKYQNRKSTLLK